MPQMLVELGEAAGKPSSRWHDEDPDSFNLLESLAQANDTSSTCSGVGPSSHTSEEHADEYILSRSEVEELIDNKCGISKFDGDWQQRICTLRQLCHYFDEQDSNETSFKLHGQLFSNEASFQCKQAMRELQHSLSKIASLPPTPASKPSGSARDKLRRLKLDVGGYIGSDILKALICLREPKICFNLLHFGHASARAESVALKRHFAAHDIVDLAASASAP